MKYLVAIVLIAGTFLVVCDAACFHQLAEQHDGEPVKGCLYKGKLHPLGKSWRTKSCWDCTCGSGGDMECCQAYGTPTGNNENCIFKFDRKACKYVLVPNKDPEKQCTGYVMVG
ncbi:beta-microseminoprotein-like [Rana temporaria]|uniref:beta-microseminoprotein-like n=1 Tax=Rana temporaria TaxID=8407 RepID=UPI001AAC480E|nr:beta-microseminoprotein-like [Rana temporaria]